MKKLKIVTLIVIICLTLPLGMNAQIVPPDDPNDAPIDGGLTLLLAAGAAYGVKKYRDGKKKQEGEGEDLK